MKKVELIQAIVELGKGLTASEKTQLVQQSDALLDALVMSEATAMRNKKEELEVAYQIISTFIRTEEETFVITMDDNELTILERCEGCYEYPFACICEQTETKEEVHMNTFTQLMETGKVIVSGYEYEQLMEAVEANHVAVEVYDIAPNRYVVELEQPVEAQEPTQEQMTTKDIEVLEAVEHAHTLNLEPSEAFLHEYKYQTLFNPQVPVEFKEALHQLMENEEEKPMIEKVYLLHDAIYRSLSDIPASCLDGTDRPREYWIINGDEDVLYSSYEEAVEESQA